MARDEEAVIARAVKSAKQLADTVLVFDTGSEDDTVNEAFHAGASIRDLEWNGFGPTLTEAMNQAAEYADWTFRLDADMTIEPHPDLRSWLAADPDPDVGAWEVELAQANWTWYLPLLTRANREWTYVGATHEYLDTTDVKRRKLLGLTVTHHADSSHQDVKLARDLALLEEGFFGGDERATFYYAWTLMDLGRKDEAIAAFTKRARMGGFEEEAWYAQYRAARLAEDVPGLIQAWERRKWRHEPLTAAGRIIAGAPLPDEDLLFRESI
jgi:glycosyltransferase involved in cell wall biosynthesis